MKSYLKLLIFKILYFNKNTRVKSSKVSLGSNIGSFCLIEKGVSISKNSIIGNYSYINYNSSIENASIGKFCSIASGVVIGPYEHDYKIISTHPFYKHRYYGFNNLFSENHKSIKKCIIGNDVWIGINSIVLSGVHIGNGAIVASGSVVTKNIPEYEIWGGVPARFIKQRFNNSVIHDLKLIDWPNKDPKWIQKHIIPNVSTDLEELCKKLLIHINE